LSIRSNSRVTIKQLYGSPDPISQPVRNRGRSDQGKVVCPCPLPKDDGTVHIMTFDLGLRVEVEHLNHLATSESEDVGGGVHHGSLSLDGTTGDLSLILEVDKGDLGWFNRDDPLVRFHGGEAMFDARFRDSKLLELLGLEQNTWLDLWRPKKVIDKSYFT
jgi:hypothetical protein